MKSNGPSWGALLSFGLAVRLVVFGLGWLVHQHWPPLPWQDVSPLAASDSGLAIWYRWDAHFYLRISQQGYDYAPPPAYSSAAFMPLLPAVMALGRLVGLDAMLVGLLVPNLAFIAGIAFFGKSAALVAKDDTVAWKACALLAAFPTAFFFGCPYGESLGFLAAAMALWAWQTQRPATCGVAVFVGTFARLTTLAIPAALGIEWCVNLLRRRNRARLITVMLITVAGLASVAIFCAYLHTAVGDAMAHMKAHEAWNRKPPHPKNIGRTLLYLVKYYPERGLWNQAIPEAIALVMFTLLGLRAWAVRGTLAGMLILLPILQAMLTGTPLSLERIVLASFVAFIDAAQLLRSTAAFSAVLLVSVLLQIALLNGYIHSQFVG
jgi:hypothetical protein